jgi:hypothetical protein
MAMVACPTHLHDQMSAPSRRFWHPVRSVSLIRGMAWEGLSDENEAVRRLSKPRLLDVPGVPSDTDMDNFRTRWDMPGQRTGITPAGWTGPVATMSDVQDSEAAMRGEIGTGVSQPVPPSGFGDIDWDSELSELSGQDSALTALGQDVSRTAEALSNGTDTPLPQRTRLSGGSVPAGFLDTLRTWNPDLMSRADFKRLSAGTHGVSVKTVGRWMDRGCPRMTRAGAGEESPFPHVDGTSAQLRGWMCHRRIRPCVLCYGPSILIS